LPENPSAAAPPPANAKEAVNLPGIFLIITGGIGIIMGLMNLAGGGMSRGLLARYADDPRVAEMIARSNTFSGVIGGIIVLATSALVIFGALKMRQLQSWGLAMAASIVALVPCFGPCCCVGIPVGIWCLVVLNKPEVKSAFQG
jgi:hypothetical protein